MRRTANNPPAYFIIDSMTKKLLRIVRGHPMKSFPTSVSVGTAFAQKLGRAVIHVVHPYVPKGAYVGMEVSPLFYHYGSNLIYPDGKMGPRNNPYSGRNPPPRSVDLKRRMVSRLRQAFKGMVDDPKGFEFDVESAIWWFANDHYKGQGDPLYGILSMSEFKPGPSHRSVDAEGEIAKMMYDELVNAFSKLNPRRAAVLRMTRRAQTAISGKVAKLVREGYPQKQAVAIAYSTARRAGYKVPAARNPSYDVDPLWKYIAARVPKQHVEAVHFHAAEYFTPGLLTSERPANERAALDRFIGDMVRWLKSKMRTMPPTPPRHEKNPYPSGKEAQDDREYKRGWSEGYALVTRDPAKAYAWLAGVYDKKAEPSWYEMGKSDVIAEARALRGTRKNPLTRAERNDLHRQSQSSLAAGRRAAADRNFSMASWYNGEASALRRIADTHDPKLARSEERRVRGKNPEVPPQYVPAGWRRPRQKDPDKAIDREIEKAWYRLASGVQVMVLDIPRIFRDIKLELAAGADMDTAVGRAITNYRKTNPRKNPRDGGEETAYLQLEAGGMYSVRFWSKDEQRYYTLGRRPSKLEAERFAKSKGFTPIDITHGGMKGGLSNPMKLLTAADRKRLPPLYSQEKLGDNAIAYVKFFTPDSSWTWYATEFDGTDQFFGLVKGLEEEIGYFSLAELATNRGPLGLHIERDLHFKPTRLGDLRGGRGLDNPKKALAGKYTLELIVIELAEVERPVRFPVADMVEASRKYSALRDQSGLGGSQFGHGTITDATGQKVATVSYNGKVWDMAGKLKYDPYAENPLTRAEKKRLDAEARRSYAEAGRFRKHGPEAQSRYHLGAGDATRSIAKRYCNNPVCKNPKHEHRGKPVRYRLMSWDEWEKEFGPIGEIGLDWTVPSDVAKVNAAAKERRAWTQVDNDYGEAVLVEGVHYVNRIQYFITEKPYAAGVQYEVVNDLAKVKRRRASRKNPLTEAEHRKILADAKFDKGVAGEYKRRGDAFMHGNYAGRAAAKEEIAHNYGVVPFMRRSNPILQTVMLAANPGETFEWATPSQAEAGVLAHKLGGGSRAEGPYLVSSVSEKKVRELAKKLGIRVAKLGATNPLTRKESGRVLRHARKVRMDAAHLDRVGRPKQALYEKGRSRGMAEVVDVYGHPSAGRAAVKIAGRIYKNNPREVTFKTDDQGRKRAYYFSRQQMRWFPMSTVDAEVSIRDGSAIFVPLTKTVMRPGGPRSNPGALQAPWKNGQRVSVEAARKWVQSTGNQTLINEFEQGFKLQCEGNRKPTHVMWQLDGGGSKGKLDAVSVLVHYGDAPETQYIPPKGSKKGARVIYRHKWGEGSGRQKPVPVYVTPDGKSIVMKLKPGQTIGDWMRG